MKWSRRWNGASLLDRALLAAGGSRWIRRRFAQILATLDGRVRLNRRVPTGNSQVLDSI